VRAHAFAKINLDLRVLGVRPDGYHELRTTFQSIALHDTLTFTPLADRSHPLVLTCDDPACPADRTNLVWRAARAMWRASGRRGDPKGLRVRLVKRIPLQAGLGGGSSDAAAALRVCAALWRVGDAAMRRAAARLGADVPYFLEGGTALGVGRGDRVLPLPDRTASWVVLVLPAFGVSTKDAYGWLDRQRAGRAGKEGGKGGDDSGNDLEGPVAAHHPEIPRIIRGLERAGSVSAAMSGGGSALFGLFTTRQAAESAARSAGGGRRRTLVTRTLSRAGYERRTASS
jgi:4-diphosphocytidyl-2-C-methyl-D-erythritol kinase